MNAAVYLTTAIWLFVFSVAAQQAKPPVSRVTLSPISVNVTSRLTMPIETSHPSTVLQPRSSTAHPVFVNMRSTVVPLITTDSSETVVVSGLIAVIMVAMITNLGLVATLVWWCHHVTKKQKISRIANTPQALDEVLVSDNPAYQPVNLQKSYQENTSISMHVTTPPTCQASPLYEIIMEVDKEHGGDDNEYDYL